MSFSHEFVEKVVVRFGLRTFNMFTWGSSGEQKCKIYISTNYFQFQPQTDCTKFTVTFISRKIRKEEETIMQNKASLFMQNPTDMG